MFTFANAGIDSGDAISSVILTVRAKDTGGGQVRLFLRTNHDSLYESAAFTLGTGYDGFTDDVTGDETWLPADFDGQGITIGYRAGGNSTTRQRRVTQIFLTIIHAPSGQTVTPEPAIATMSAPSTTVALGVATATPSAVAAPMTSPAHTVSLGAISFIPAAVVVTMSAPTVTISQATTISPTPATVSASVPSTTMALGVATATPDASSVAMTAPASTIALGAITISPILGGLSITAPGITVSQEGNGDPEVLHGWPFWRRMI